MRRPNGRGSARPAGRGTPSWSSPRPPEAAAEGAAGPRRQAAASVHRARPVTELEADAEIRVLRPAWESWTGSWAAGAVKGSLVLVGGAPGIGKSTLMLQICDEPLPREQGAVCIRRGVGASAEAPGKATATCRANGLFVISETSLGDLLESVAAEAAGHPDRGLHPDPVQRRAGVPGGQRQPGEGLHHGPDAAGQGAGDHGLRHRPRQQGGLHRRPQGAGAHGGLRAVL